MSDQASDPNAGHDRWLNRHSGSFLIRCKVKSFALTIASDRKKLSTGQPRFTRVSEEFVDRMNAQIRAMIRAEIIRLPSNGRTIR